MILLHSDYLIFKTELGEQIPCPAYLVIIELVGKGSLDLEVIYEFSEIIVHYFRSELGRELVSVAEFSKQLECILSDHGFEFTRFEDPPTAPWDPSFN